MLAAPSRISISHATPCTLQAGKYKLDALVAHECKLDHINKAIAGVWRGDEGRVLVAVE